MHHKPDKIKLCLFDDECPKIEQLIEFDEYFIKMK